MNKHDALERVSPEFNFGKYLRIQFWDFFLPDSILVCFLVYHVSYTHFQVGSDHLHRHLDDAVQVYADAAALVKAVRKSFCWVGNGLYQWSSI